MGDVQALRDVSPPHGRSPVGAAQALGEEAPPHGQSPVGAAQALGEETPRHGRLPVSHLRDSGEDTPPHGRSPVRIGEGTGGESQLLPGSSFTSGVPLTPGRGFRDDDMAQTSSEQEHLQHEEIPLHREESTE